MANEVTRIEDVIVPEIFTTYVEEQTTEKSVLLNSGVIVNDTRINEKVSGGGVTFNMPKWEDLTGEDEPFNEDEGETAKRASHNEIGTAVYRRKAWAFNDLAASFAGDDPMKDIGDAVSRFWVRKEKNTAISILNGVFDSADMADHVLDVTSIEEIADKNINAANILDAKQLMGDAAEELKVLYMHSAAKTQLEKDLLIKPIVLPNTNITMPSYLGYIVLSDDSVPYKKIEGGKAKFTTYLLGYGCLKRGVGTPVGFKPTATDRKEELAQSRLFSRRAFCIHPAGISWNARPADIEPNKTPSNEQLATGANWKRVAAEHKMVKMVKLIHYIDL